MTEVLIDEKDREVHRSSLWDIALIPPALILYFLPKSLLYYGQMISNEAVTGKHNLDLTIIRKYVETP